MPLQILNTKQLFDLSDVRGAWAEEEEEEEKRKERDERRGEKIEKKRKGPKDLAEPEEE